jgi:hypothetical protein
LGQADGNATITQLFHAISHCDVISNSIAIQLDNCTVNKNYNVLGAFGLLLMWVPDLLKVTKVRLKAQLL